MYGNKEKALENYKAAESTNYEKIEEIYYQLGLVYSTLNQFSNSIRYIQQALEIYLGKMDIYSSVSCKMMLAINYRRIDELQKALDIYTELLENNNIKDCSLLWRIYHNIGLVLIAMGKLGEAIDYLIKSVELNNEKSQFVTIYLVIKLYIIQNDYQAINEWFCRGIRILDEYKNEEFKIKFNVLKFFIDNKELTDEFIEYMNTHALPFFEEITEVSVIKEYLYYLAKAYQANFKHKQAFLTLEKIVKYDTRVNLILK